MTRPLSSPGQPMAPDGPARAEMPLRPAMAIMGAVIASMFISFVLLGVALNLAMMISLAAAMVGAALAGVRFETSERCLTSAVGQIIPLVLILFRWAR
ncbi:hypothetical protein KM176_07035 [Pseudooceanicola sp. CBS1P-1]|uniref:Uncharacterized protein n=1 Tax=Pseudooceanicola albus TaxID=2692189 RepID=A0A6L7G053_9RHOB|nr:MULTISPECIES: hypothetical protein [Pseudooceanicola]MBT9383606.1 hypothetical protein [Pseudooceanicola endophyticus]MXN17461.1 hypothetical protein [Pseudooceanicola albus]